MNNNSLFIKPLGDRWQIISASDVIKYINETLEEHYVPLTKEQKYFLREDWYHCNNMPFFAYDWAHEKEVKNNILWRLSVVFFIPWVVLMLLFIPFKWVFTGKSFYHIDPKKKTISSITIKWYQKCFNIDNN